MRRIVVLSIVLLLFTVIQSSPLYDGIRDSLSVKPDLILILVVFLGFRAGSFTGLIFGFAAGLLQDIASTGSPLGFHAFLYVNIGLFSGFFRNKVYPESRIGSIMLVLGATVFKSILSFLILSLFFGNISISAVQLRNQLLLETVFNAILAPIFFLLFDRVLLIFIRRPDSKAEG